jgi:hypothetical protein
MEKHITLVGVLNIVYRSLSILGAAILVAITVWCGYLVENLIRWGSIRSYEISPGVLNIVTIVLLFLAAAIFIVSAAGIIGAIGVLRRKQWGRILLLVVSFFSLVRIPLGTLLGVYSIWVLLNDETITLFNQAAGTPVPSPTSGGPPR